MKLSRLNTPWITACIIGALCLFLIIFQAVMESRTYNRLTGAKTTWWDAMWVELRVTESPKP